MLGARHVEPPHVPEHATTERDLSSGIPSIRVVHFFIFEQSST